jgi:class 3 adenylate cyclase
VLSAAAVVGRSFDLATLAEVTAVDQTSVLSAIETGVMYQLLEEDRANYGRYQFRHALTREAVYEDMVVPRRQQLHARVAEVLSSRPDRAAIDLAHHLLLAGKFDEAVGMCVAAAEDANNGRAYRDAAALLERAAPHVKDPAERGRLLCQAGEAYWNNGEPGLGKTLLEAGVADLEAAGLTLEAAGWRVLLGRCYWETQRSDLAREQFERARDVLETAGPSEALAVAYIRLSGLDVFDRTGDGGIGDAQRAAEIATAAGSGMALAWSWNFLALAKIGSGLVDEGFRHIEDSYEASLKGGYDFQGGNAVYNASWMAVHLGQGRRARLWVERIDTASPPGFSWPSYVKALYTLHTGRVNEAISLARRAQQSARELGHEKMGWRSSVLLAHTLAENLKPAEALAELPPMSSRVDGQDAVYDGAPRVRTHLAVGDVQGALADAKSVSPAQADLGSPADAVAEGAEPDPTWLRTFIEGMPKHAGDDGASPRTVAALGRLALYEGRFEDAARLLTRSEQSFREEGFLLDAWHVGRALAEAEAGAGDKPAAQHRLQTVIAEAEEAGAMLAAKLARDTARKVGLEVAPSRQAEPAPAAADRVSTGERMVSVLFADVRGFTEMSGRIAPADMLERIGSLQRWASQEVGKHHGSIDKFAGDAIMATFNISGERVDHTLDALRAAIAIIDKAALAGLPVGAGIAVGPAVVGRLADSANVSVLGEVTNLAARLQAQSPGGEVTLSEEALRRVSGWLEERRLEPQRLELDLKGFANRIVAYRVRTGVSSPLAGEVAAKRPEGM